MNTFLVPANSKKGTLIFNIFRPFDLILFGTGIGISLILLVLFPDTTDPIGITLVISPALFCGLLVLPIPNYHNVLTAFLSMISFFTNRRRYIWKGWCFYERFLEEYQKESQKK